MQLVQDPLVALRANAITNLVLLARAHPTVVEQSLPKLLNVFALQANFPPATPSRSLVPFGLAFRRLGGKSVPDAVRSCSIAIRTSSCRRCTGWSSLQQSSRGR